MRTKFPLDENSISCRTVGLILQCSGWDRQAPASLAQAGQIHYCSRERQWHRATPSPLTKAQCTFLFVSHQQARPVCSTNSEIEKRFSKSAVTTCTLGTTFTEGVMQSAKPTRPTPRDCAVQKVAHTQYRILNKQNEHMQCTKA